MNARMRLALLRLSDPRLVRLFVVILMLVLSLVMQQFPGAEPVFACPSGTGGGGCDGSS
jgi:hypothetical protein